MEGLTIKEINRTKGTHDEEGTDDVQEETAQEIIHDTNDIKRRIIGALENK